MALGFIGIRAHSGGGGTKHTYPITIKLMIEGFTIWKGP
jgi:hypothetical protein